MANKPYHKAAHRRLGTPAVEAAWGNPSYRCPLCGLTHAEGVKVYGEAGASWERGHKHPGRMARSVHDYEAQHAHCNRSDGQRIASKLRSNPTSRRW